MKHAEYLGPSPTGDHDGQVQRFVEWLSQHLDDQVFRHEYTIRRTGERWQCDSLYDAYVKYEWAHPEIKRLGVPTGRTFASNVRALQALRDDLIAALAANDDIAVRIAAVDVMRWGGVSNGNVSWLNGHESGLATLIRNVRDALNAGDTLDAGLVPDIRFNAGMTKVYSLVCDNFVIYDSRVAAALGWAVAKYLGEAKNAVPECLSFPWAPAKESPNAPAPKRRNPGGKLKSFPRLVPGLLHAQWNLRASWLLNAVLDRCNEKGSRFASVGERPDQLRALEAALFMFGYDLPRDGFEPEVESSVHGSNGWLDCETLGFHVGFKYRIAPSGIETVGGDSNSPKKFSDAVLNKTLSVLLEWFGSGPFPLANSATRVREGSEKRGVGCAYFMAKPKGNPPDTSRLVAVLEDVEILLPANAGGNGQRMWTLNSEALRIGPGDSMVDIRPYLDDCPKTD